MKRASLKAVSSGPLLASPNHDDGGGASIRLGLPQIAASSAALEVVQADAGDVGETHVAWGHGIGILIKNGDHVGQQEPTGVGSHVFVGNTPKAGDQGPAFDERLGLKTLQMQTGLLSAERPLVEIGQGLWSPPAK